MLVKKMRVLKTVPFSIVKGSAPSLTFSKRTKTFTSGGSFSTVEILAGVQGTKTGYTLKSIASLSPSGVASVSGTKPNLALNFTKAGLFTATIVLEHSSKADATITGAQFEISRGSAPSLTFSKRTKTFTSGGSFSTAEILAGVQGAKTGYTLKSISNLSPSGVASVSGTKPNLALNFTKSGSFTATIVLEHATKAEVTITGVQFEIKAKKYTWSQSFNHGNKSTAGTSIIQTSDGGYAIAGGIGGNRAYVAKFDESGDKTWDRNWRLGSDGGLRSIIQMRDKSFVVVGTYKVTSSSDYDSHIRKLSPTGNLVWQKSVFLSKDDSFSSVIEASDGGVVVTGEVYNPSSSRKYDIWLYKFDTNGNKVFEYKYGTTDGDYARSIAATADGGCIVTGLSYGLGLGYSDIVILKFDNRGRKIWDKGYGGSSRDIGNSIIQTNDGGYIIAGITDSYGAGGMDYLVLKINVNGLLVWSKTFGGPQDDIAASIVQTTDGGYAVVGYTKSKGRGKEDVWLVKIDASGNKVWDKAFGSSGVDRGLSLIQTKDKGYAIVGQRDVRSDSADIWFIKTDKNGNL